MRTIKNKLNSQRGASLTFALLLFLVCAVVGSAVLVAGTAAAGRMSRIAEMDQRYYSVNSAARLLIELMEKDMIRCEPPEEDDGDYTYYLVEKNGEKAITTYPLTLDIAKRAMQKRKASNAETEEDTAETSGTVGTTDAVTLTLAPAEDLGANLNVTIAETISANGDVVMELKNKEGDSYAITLYFMNVGGTSSFKWKLYDIDSQIPSAS